MTKLWLKLIVVVAIFTVLADTASAIPYRGELTGVWTVGVAEFGIAPGDSFAWYYIYESEKVDGCFGMASPPAGSYVLRSDIPGLEGKMDRWAAGFLTVQDDRVVQALLRYEFDDPRIPPAVSIFHIGLQSFSGFGEGTVAYSNPCPVPDSANTVACLFASVGCLLVGRRFMRTTGTYA
jgi:hypothetical protein